jgi:hypothetical protein
MSNKKEKELLDKLGQLTNVPLQVFPATVTAVDEENSTVDVIDTYDTEYYDVRLKASVDNEKSEVIMIPEIDSSVLVGLIGNSEYALYLVKESKVNKIYADIAGSKIQIDSAGVKINDGENGPVLVSQSLIDDLNAIKKDLNDLKKVFLGWTIPKPDGGEALKTAAATWAASELKDTEIGAVTNEKFQH